MPSVNIVPANDIFSSWVDEVEALLKAALQVHQARNCWRFLQQALASLRLYMEIGDLTYQNTVCATLRNRIRDIQQVWKSAMPYLWGMGSPKEPRCRDWEQVVFFARDGIVPEPKTRWTKPFEVRDSWKVSRVLPPKGRRATSAPAPVRSRPAAVAVATASPKRVDLVPRQEPEPTNDAAIQELRHHLRPGMRICIAAGRYIAGDIKVWLTGGFSESEIRIVEVGEHETSGKSRFDAMVRSIRQDGNAVLILMTSHMSHDVMRSLRQQADASGVPHAFGMRPTRTEFNRAFRVITEQLKRRA